MGGINSKNNDELVDLLVTNGNIKSIDVERVFRLVDRGRFFPRNYKDEAYKESPFKVPDHPIGADEWNPGRFHISAPSMYGQVVEKLELRPGLSFLNIGSGSGWLNTAVGFLLGSNGINHGIEVHKNLVDFSNDRLKETIMTPELACFPFTAPVFFHGNALSQMPSDTTRSQYDRIYCGAAVNDMKSVYKLIKFLDIGGRLVAPVNHMLMCYIRTSEKRFLSQRIVTCQFADLVASSPEDQTTVLPPLIRPLSLQHLCRTVIRGYVRECVSKNTPLVMRSVCADPDTAGGLNGPHIVYIQNADDHGHVRVNVVAGEDNNGRVRILQNVARLRVVIPHRNFRDQDGDLQHLAEGGDLLVHEVLPDGGRLDVHELPEEGAEDEPERPQPLPQRRIFFDNNDSDDDEEEEEEPQQPVDPPNPPQNNPDGVPEAADDDLFAWPAFADEVDAVADEEIVERPPEENEDNASEGSSSSDEGDFRRDPHAEFGQDLGPLVWEGGWPPGRPRFLSYRRRPRDLRRGDADEEEESNGDSNTAKRRKVEPQETKIDRSYRLQRESIHAFSDAFLRRVDDLQPMPIPLVRYLKHEF